ncbi:MAG: hypothetical protein H6623_04925 [Bdellovibrionaceae bacterium]|nr:hypothetical protein [Pseudobdellovibrionaceae bacterium]
MGYRIKFLIFLGVFLVGAFSIVTWKAFRVYSESYVESSLQSEMEVLEGRVQSIVSEFERFKSLALTKENIDGRLRLLEIPLMAHVIFEEGKWKAQWFEGVKGMREQGKTLASQVAFENLPQSRNSWTPIYFSGQQKGFTFVIPSLADKSVHFFAFFLDGRTMNNLMQKGTIVENMHIIAPQAGDIYATSNADKNLVDQAFIKVKGKAQGTFLESSNNKIVLFQFHPFLQAYVLKVIPKLRVTSPPLSRFYGLVFFATILVSIALFAMNLLFTALFQRLNNAVEQIGESAHIEPTAHVHDELSQIENIAIHLHEQPDSRESAHAPVPFNEKASQTPVVHTPPAPIQAEERLADDDKRIFRSRVINCLGYLNRIKAQFQLESPHVVLLEQELRELRKIIDPVLGGPTKEALNNKESLQPSFDPILANYQIEQETPVTLASVVDEMSEVDATLNAPFALRRPKRETNDFGDI